MNQGVEMQKLKSSMQSFDKSASKISHWFDRNRYAIKNMKEGIERYSDYENPSSQSSLILKEKRLKKMLEPRLQSSKEHKKRCPVCTNAYGSLPGVASKLHIKAVKGQFLSVTKGNEKKKKNYKEKKQKENCKKIK